MIYDVNTARKRLNTIWGKRARLVFKTGKQLVVAVARAGVAEIPHWRTTHANGNRDIPPVRDLFDNVERGPRDIGEFRHNWIFSINLKRVPLGVKKSGEDDRNGAICGN